MKKYTALFMTALIFISVITGCSKSNDKSDTNENISTVYKEQSTKPLG